jgi:hypothetical protein
MSKTEKWGGVLYRLMLLVTFAYLSWTYAAVPTGEVPFAVIIFLFAITAQIISDAQDTLKALLRRY